ncbi:type II secretion system F family protein [Sutcliffiella rhizosphaerae]|uniref:Type II secretion system protein GspF domain-containing protein n=1 Tax=Sutcliffiella rhizosphaerae TaxID=2880967 RepID=A0ABM8YK93_9BACI|nr:type II secretion system F family protein [Sutcliffiella rhizosphaerae]CAG9620275.1 hypothetical protein BACCIP111883_01043 [Sutcliffiella rhizosphaerae]
MMFEASLAGLAALLFIWGMYAYLGFRKEKKEIKQVFGAHFQKNQERTSFISTIGDRFDTSKQAAKVKEKLLQANVTLLPSEFYAILILIGFAIGIFMFTVMNMSFFTSFLVGGIISICSNFLFFIIRKNKYMDRMSDQLSEVCRMMANSTKAGLTINQAVEVVAGEVGGPAGEEFKNMAHNLRLGVDMERVLKQLERRVPTKEFKLFVATILIQRKSGGNLSAVLDEMARTLDERKILKQTIKTMTAEQRFISYILPAMPIVMIFMMNTVMDGFISPIFTLPGMILLIIFTIGLIISFVLVRAVTNIRV